MTAMSSRRSFEQFVPKAEKPGSAGLSVLAFFVGLVLLVVGIYTDITFLAAIGFIPFTSALLYWNAMFWSKILGDQMVQKTWRYLPY